jgi:Glyoxalase/Bleomycin resistance protein/Dioxygenase superfamily
LFQAPPALAFFDCDGIRLMLTVPEEKEFDHPGSPIYFRVDDIESAYADLKSKGVEFRGEPHMIEKMPDHELWMAYCPKSPPSVCSLRPNTSRGSLIVIQQPTEPRTPTDPALASARRAPVDKPILESLVIPLAMVVIDEFLEGASKVALAEGYHSIEALVLDGPHEPLGVRVRIGRPKRRLHDVQPGIAQQLSHVPAPLSVTLTNQHAMGTQQAVRRGQRATHLPHEQSVGMWC